MLSRAPGRVPGQLCPSPAPAGQGAGPSAAAGAGAIGQPSRSPVRQETRAPGAASKQLLAEMLQRCGMSAAGLLPHLGPLHAGSGGAPKPGAQLGVSLNQDGATAWDTHGLWTWPGESNRDLISALGTAPVPGNVRESSSLRVCRRQLYLLTDTLVADTKFCKVFAL